MSGLSVISTDHNISHPDDYTSAKIAVNQSKVGFLLLVTLLLLPLCQKNIFGHMRNMERMWKRNRIKTDFHV